MKKKFLAIGCIPFSLWSNITVSCTGTTSIPTTSQNIILPGTGCNPTINASTSGTTTWSGNIEGSATTLTLTGNNVVFDADNGTSWTNTVTKYSAKTYTVDFAGSLGADTNTIVPLGTSATSRSIFSIGNGLNLSVPILLQNGATPTFAAFPAASGTATCEVSGLISGTGGITYGTITGGTTYISNSSNSYTGGTTFGNGEILEIDSAGALGPGTLTFVEGQLSTLTDLTLTQDLIFGSSSEGFIVPATGTTLTISGQITAAPTSVIDTVGDGTVVLTNTSNNIQGSLQIGHTASPGPGGTLVISSPTNLFPGATPPNFVLGPNSGNTFEMAASMTLDIPINFFHGYTHYLKADGGTVCTLEGQIFGGGSLGVPGPGTLILTNATNSWPSGSYLIGGILEITTAGALSTGPVFFEGGTLEFAHSFAGANAIANNFEFDSSGTIICDAGTSSTITGVFSGTGSLTLPGPGNLALTGNNSAYSGEIFIDGGILRVLSGNNLGTGGLSFNHGTLEISSSGYTSADFFPLFFDPTYSYSYPGFSLGDPSFSYSAPITLAGPGTVITDAGINATIGSVISGPGNLTTSGPGTLILTGHSTYTGTTVEEEGSLYVDGSLQSPLTTVQYGALIGGMGSIQALDLFGTLMPGDLNTIGTFTTANLTFEPGSTYAVSLIGAATDLTEVHGSVAIHDGTTLTICPSKLTLPEYVIIDSTGPVLGEFTTVVNMCARYNFAVLYDPHQVILAFTGIVPFPNIVPHGNLRKIAECFETLPITFDLLDILEVLDTLSATQIIQAFNQFDPSQFNAVNWAEQELSETVRQQYTDHLSACGSCCTPLRAWSLAFGQEIDQSSSGSFSAESGYHNQAWGAIAGIDYFPLRNLAFSSGVSYAYSDLGLNGSGIDSHGHFNSYTVSLNSLFRHRAFRLDGYFGFSYHFANLHRHIFVAAQQMTKGTPIPPINRTLTHRNASYGYLGHLGSSYSFSVGRYFNFYPFINLDYLYLSQNRFEEHGGGALDMLVKQRGTDLLRPEGGIGLCFDRIYCGLKLWGDASLSYVGEFRFQGQSLRGAFIENRDCLFTLKGALPTNHLFSPFVRLGLSGCCSPVSLFASYRGAYGEHFASSDVSLELQYCW